MVFHAYFGCNGIPGIVELSIVEIIFKFLILLFIAQAGNQIEVPGQSIGNIGKGGVGVPFNIPVGDTGYAWIIRFDLGFQIFIVIVIIKAETALLIASRHSSASAPGPWPLIHDLLRHGIASGW